MWCWQAGRWPRGSVCGRLFCRGIPRSPWTCCWTGISAFRLCFQNHSLDILNESKYSSDILGWHYKLVMNDIRHGAHDQIFMTQSCQVLFCNFSILNPKNQYFGKKNQYFSTWQINACISAKFDHWLHFSPTRRQSCRSPSTTQWTKQSKLTAFNLPF